MSDEIKKPPPLNLEDDPDAPPSAEEVAASQRLRDALAKGAPGGYEEMAIVDSLRSAWSPSPLHEGVHAEMLDDLPLSDEEMLLAAELREELGRGAGASSDVLVTALQAAWNPKALSEAEHDAILVRVVGAREGGRSEGRVVEFRPRKQARTMRVVTVTTTAVLALAASVFLFINMSKDQKSEQPVAMVKARSTQPLFGEPFKAGEAGNASARIDKIAMARASDYRDNRFAKWGVR